MSLQKINTLFLYWGKRGGGAKYSFEIARELSKREDTNLHLSISNQCELFDQFMSLELPGLYIDTYRSISGFLYTWFFRKRFFRQALEAYFKKHRIDSVIIGMDFFWSPVVYRAAKSADVKTILVVHEPKPHPNEPFYLSLFKKNTLKKGIKGADHIVALTTHVKNIIRDEFDIKPEMISVIPHGIFEYYKIETPRELPQDNSTINILYFGRIEYYKGLDILIKSFRILQREFANVKLEIWGSGNLDDYRDEIEGVEHIHIENRWVDEDEITGVFKTCHICVLPYRQASQSGIAGIASRAGMPVVACPAQGLKEQLEDCGALLSDDFSPESLYKTIAGLIKNPDLYHSLSEKSILYAENLSWNHIAEKFADLTQGNVTANEQHKT